MSARRGERYTPDEIGMIRRLAGEGRTGREIARALERTSYAAIDNIRRREGISPGKRRLYTIEEDVAIREAVAAGRSSREIAEETGRTTSAVQNRRKTELIEEPHRGPAQIAAEARREAHIAALRERKAARMAERKSVIA